MKQSTLQSYWIVALLGLALGASHLQAQNIARGRSFLKVEAYSEAYDEFLKETRLKPKDPEAQTLAGLANFVNITKSDSFNSFLDRLGFDKQGRELDDWTSAMDTEAMKDRLKSEKMNGQELADFIQNGLISNLEKSLNHFKAIPTGKSFLIFLSEDETQISDVFLDQGDVSMIQALIELIRFALNGVSAQDMHVDIQSILNLLDDEISADAFMRLNPDFMKNVSQNNLKAARASFIGFIDYYMAGSELLKNRTTKTLNHLVSIDEEEEELEADFREHLNHLRFEESVNSLFRIEIKESTVTFSADPVRLFETPLRSLTRVDGLVGVIHQEAEQMATQVDRDIEKLSKISRARIIQPDNDGEGPMADGADILFLQGALELAHGLSATLSAHDLDVGVQEIIKLRNQEKLDAQNILKTNPTLLNLESPSVMPLVRDWLTNANQNLKNGYTLLQGRQEGKIGILVPDEAALVKTLEPLDTILTSGIKAHELSGTFEEGKYLLHPNPLWEGKANIRNLLPNFNTNDPVPGTLPDATMAGLFPDKIFINPQSKIEKFRAPYILKQPKNTSVQPGEEAIFSLQVSGPGALKYQWYKDGKVINGAKQSSYSISNVYETDFGFYSVSVKNDLGKAVSSLVELKKIKAPQIITQPKSNYVFLGSNLKLEVIAEGSEPLSYQWHKDSEPLIGANETIYTKDNITRLDYGEYLVEITNSVGKARSLVVHINQATAPRITEQPAFQELEYGSNAEFQVTAIGTEPLNYLWFKDGKPIDNATTSLLRLENITKEDEAIYSVRVKNLFGKAISEIAKLRVKTDPPLITLQPKSIEQYLGDTGVFSILATGNKPLRYQWYKNGKVIKGATEPTLTITNISEDDITIFSVSVNNDFGKAVSMIAQLSLTKPVTLTVASRDPDSWVTVKVSPADRNGQAGGTTQFTRAYSKGTEVTLTAMGSAAGNQFKQWLKNGVYETSNPKVTVTMDYDRTLRAVYELPPRLGITTGEAGYSLSVSGAVGQTYYLEFSANLIEWLGLSRVTIPEKGTVVIDFGPAAGNRNRYYRVSYME